MTQSRLPGFFKLSVQDRRQMLATETGLGLEELSRVLESGGLDTAQADKIVENVVGTYRLPLGVATNFRINGADRLVPLVVEEPSVIAAASNAAKMIRHGGGFVATMHTPLMIGQIELRDVPQVEQATHAIQEAEPELLDAARAAVPGLVRRGGGPRRIEVRQIGPDHLVVHLLVDCLDAMGANLVNSAAEALSEPLCQRSGARPGLRILSNLADERVVEVSGRAPFSSLGAGLEQDPCDIGRAIEAASIFAERDPYRAATHNKGIMNGVDSVVLATGNDYRAVEAGAHAYAARNGRYEPLATWRVDGDSVLGEMRIPLALGTVGGTLRVHEAARAALEIAGVSTATDLAYVCASAGLASNLAAIRALATEGIQRGHMALHARAVATAAGARGDEVERVARIISEAKTVTRDAAQSALLAQRRGNPDGGSEQA